MDTGRTEEYEPRNRTYCRTKKLVGLGGELNNYLVVWEFFKCIDGKPEAKVLHKCQMFRTHISSAKHF